MPKAKPKNEPPQELPMLKTIEQMSRICGIGENRLRELIDLGEVEYIQNGKRKLLADSAIWDWYERTKTFAPSPKQSVRSQLVEIQADQRQFKNGREVTEYRGRYAARN